MNDSGAQWTRPELVVIIRTKPEESVLATCKTAASATGLASENLACYQVDVDCVNCQYDIPS